MKKHTWFQLAEHPEINYGQYMVPNFISNSVAIQSSKNHWVMISPGAKMLDDWPKELKKNKHIRISIIFPNHFHYLGVKAWLETYPDAHLYASTKAIPRLKKMGFSAIQALEVDQPELPEGYQILFPPGHRGGDIWISKKTKDDCIWITCDSFLNYDRVSNQPIARLMQKALGAAPGLKISQVIKWLLLDKRNTFRDWCIKQIEKDQPNILIPSHGEVEKDSGLADRLRSMVSKRL